MKLMLTGLAGAAEAACGARSAPSDSGTTAAIAIMRSLLICPPGSGFAPGRLTSSRLLTVMERDCAHACGRTLAARKTAPLLHGQATPSTRFCSVVNPVGKDALTRKHGPPVPSPP